MVLTISIFSNRIMLIHWNFRTMLLWLYFSQSTRVWRICRVWVHEHPRVLQIHGNLVKELAHGVWLSCQNYHAANSSRGNSFCWCDTDTSGHTNFTIALLFGQKDNTSTSLFAVAVGIKQKDLVDKMVKMVDDNSFVL